MKKIYTKRYISKLAQSRFNDIDASKEIGIAVDPQTGDYYIVESGPDILVPPVLKGQLRKEFINAYAKAGRQYDEEQGVRLKIDQDVSGYNDPGISMGRLEDSYPPEGEINRNVQGIDIVDFDGTVLAPLSSDSTSQILDLISNYLDQDAEDIETWSSSTTRLEWAYNYGKTEPTIKKKPEDSQIKHLFLAIIRLWLVMEQLICCLRQLPVNTCFSIIN